jgi:hypothetical protein
MADTTLDLSYVNCEDQAYGAFIHFDAAWHIPGSISVNWLTSANLDTGCRAYQREKVANELWNQGILETIFTKAFAGIPEIHIRVIKIGKNAFRFEIVDGQQRLTAILKFLAGEFSLPKFAKALQIDGQVIDISGMSIDDIRAYPVLYDRISDYRITCKWYLNLSNEQTSDLFVNVLNNVTTMKPQEIRNAVQGPYSDYIRNTARFENLNDLFRRVSVSGDKEQMLHFGSKFHLKGRMEVDEWLSEIAYLKLHGYRQGIQNQTVHTDWVKNQQVPGGEYREEFTDQKVIDKLLKFALKIIQAVPREHKSGRSARLNPWTSMLMVLYADDLKTRYGKIIPSHFTEAFFDVYARWSDTTAKLYMNETTTKGDQMGPFNKLFGAKNPIAVGTILKVLDLEFAKNKRAFGVVEIDPVKTFTEKDIRRKWAEQGYKDYYTGQNLDGTDLHGDHYIPLSMGIDMGGVTEYHNLVVCSGAINLDKGNQHGEDYIKSIQRDWAQAAE